MATFHGNFINVNRQLARSLSLFLPLQSNSFHIAQQAHNLLMQFGNLLDRKANKQTQQRTHTHTAHKFSIPMCVCVSAAIVSCLYLEPFEYEIFFSFSSFFFGSLTRVS